MTIALCSSITFPFFTYPCPFILSRQYHALTKCSIINHSLAFFTPFNSIQSQMTTHKKPFFSFVPQPNTHVKNCQVHFSVEVSGLTSTWAGLQKNFFKKSRPIHSIHQPFSFSNKLLFSPNKTIVVLCPYLKISVQSLLFFTQRICPSVCPYLLLSFTRVETKTEATRLHFSPRTSLKPLNTWAFLVGSILS